MRKTAFILACAALLVLPVATFAQELTAVEVEAPIEKTFVLNRPDFEPETKKELVQDLTPDFSKKAGGDLFTARFGADRFRYEYNGEWIEFEPQGHAPALTAELSNQLTYSDYWADTDLRFEVRDYGVKVDIILRSDKAPTEFSFRISKSPGWQDEWIRPAYLFTDDGTTVSIIEETWNWQVGILTYTVPEEAAIFPYPQIIDPTFELGGSVDDTWAQDPAVLNTNSYTSGSTYFGKHVNFWNRDQYAFFRWTIDLPRASKILAANMSCKAAQTQSGSFNTTIYGLEKDNKWEASGGFNTTNYANATDLLAIAAMSTSSTWNSVAAWTSGSWYDTADIADTVQAQVDELYGSNEYDPTHSENKYVGFYIDSGDGTYNPACIRGLYTYDNAPVAAAELDVTFDSWGTVMVQGGFRCDSDGLRWYN